MKLFAYGNFRKGKLQMVVVRHSPPPKQKLHLLKRKQRRSARNHPNHYLTLTK